MHHDDSSFISIQKPPKNRESDTSQKSGATSQEVLGVGRTADGAQGFLVPALKSRLQVWRKVSQGRMKMGASFRFGFSPMGGCQRRTALMAPAIGGVKLVVCGDGLCTGLRMQQACGGGAEIARATGAIVPTSNRTSNNLAVRRCMTS